MIQQTTDVRHQTQLDTVERCFLDTGEQEARSRGLGNAVDFFFKSEKIKFKRN